MDSEVFHSIVEGAPDPIIIQTAGKFAWLNPAACRLMGIRNPEDLIGKPFMGQVHPDYQDIVGKWIQALTEGRIQEKALPEHKIIGVKGNEIWVKGTGKPLTFKGKSGCVVFVHDITESIITEKQLKLLSRSVEQSPVSIAITDIDGHIEYVNPAFEKTTGYSREEITGKTMRVLKSGSHSREFYKELWAAILSGRNWSGELKNKKKNGEIYWEEASISPIFNQQGEIVNFVSVSEDITGSKMMVEHLIQAKEKAEENDRLKTAFLANMSHEIRTPMNAIMGFAEILKEPGLAGKMQKEFIDKIEKSGRRMLDTVNNLIDVAKIETGQVKMDISEADLNRRLEDIVALYRHWAEQKKLQLILKEPVPSRYADLKTDHTKLDSILTNLIKNAIKFTGKGKVEVGCTHKGVFLEFYVSDTGIGVPQNLQKRIFNRFERVETDDARFLEGSGLGLPISKAYVELLGGEIRVESERGEGSTFYFTIPLNQAEDQKVPETERKIPRKNGIPELKGGKIMIVEDDLFSLEIINYLLKKTGATVLVAKNGSEAVKEFDKENVDLVLLDIRLPEMDGYEVLKNLRAKNPSIPVIAQTAYVMPEDIKKFREAGFTDYLAKPVGHDELFGMLGKYLNP